MATSTLRPNGTVAAGGWALTGAATHHAATSDGNNNGTGTADGTYSTGYSPEGDTYLRLDLATVAVPALAQIRSVTPRARIRQTSSFGTAVQFGLELGGVQVFSNPGIIDTVNFNHYTGSASTTKPTGGAWSQADLDALIFVASWGYPGSVDFSEAYVDVVYNEAPTVAVSGPAAGSTITTTATPTVQWNFTDPESDAQERFRVKVFAGSGTVADPETAVAVWDSGETFSASSFVVVGQALVPGDYRVYVKAADAGSNGRYSLWVTNGSFTIAVDAPATPTLVATVDAALARIALTVDSVDNLLTYNQSTAETDSTGMEADVAVTVGPTSFGGATAPPHGSKVWQWTAGGTTRIRTVGINVIPVTPGQTITLRADMRRAAAGAARSGEVRARFWTAGGVQVGADLTAGAAVSVVNTGWVTAAGQVTVPATAAYVQLLVHVAAVAAEVFWADRLGVFDGTVATWTKGGLATIGGYVIERSIDGGTTWAPVRGANPATRPAYSQVVTVYDYEVARGVTATYRALTQLVDPQLVTTVRSAASATDSKVMAATGWWLKDPLSPGLNMQVEVQPGFGFRRKEPQSVFEPVGRNVSVVVSDGVRGIEGSLTVWAKTAARYAKVQAIVASGHSLWLEDVFGRAWYVHFGDATEWSLLRAAPIAGETTPIRHIHTVTLPFVEVGSPAGDTVTAGTPTP